MDLYINARSCYILSYVQILNKRDRGQRCYIVLKCTYKYTIWSSFQRARMTRFELIFFFKTTLSPAATSVQIMKNGSNNSSRTFERVFRAPI